MKSVCMAFATASLCALFAVNANAQEIKNPAKIKPVGLGYDYYGIGQPAAVETSPSDVKEAASGCDAAPAAGCDSNGCDSNGCNDCCCDCSCYLWGPDEAWTLFPSDNCCGPNIGGWFSFGYHDGPTPLSVQRGDGLAFNDVPDALNLHQAWLYIEREAEGGSCCWDWGYRFDLMYGTDAQKTQAFGNPAGIPGGGPRNWDNQWDHGVYGWAIPQAYVEVARGDLSIIGGHFYTLIGYEVVPATGNFFYSHSLTMFNSEPFTHTGILATYSVSDDTEVYAGWTLGWDTGFDQFGNGNSFLGGFSTSVADDIGFTYIVTAGDLGARGNSGYTHSIVLDFTLTDNLEYVVQSDYVGIKPDAVNGGATNDQVGVNQYLFYAINDCVKLGGRLEWWKSDGVSFYEVTGGINIKPHANLTVRPEIRYDWQGNLVNPNNGLPQSDTTTFGIDAIVTY